MLILFVVLLISISAPAQTLDQAINNKWVSAVIKTLPTSDSRSGGNSYYGSSILLVVKNERNIKTDISVESGRMLNPEDTFIQRMLVVDDLMISLAPGESREVPLMAFCSQMSKTSPGSNSTFRIGKRATGHLLSLSQLLSKHRIFDYAAQNAIWCITDNNDLASIHSDNAEHTKILREFVSKATGKKLVHEVVSHPEHTSEVNAKDTIVFSNREGGNLTLEFLNQEGEAVHSFFKDKYYRPATRHTIRYSIMYAGLPAGKYYVRLQRNNSIIYNKEILVKVVE
jgi:hypothetical protein